MMWCAPVRYETTVQVRQLAISTKEWNQASQDELGPVEDVVVVPEGASSFTVSLCASCHEELETTMSDAQGGA